MASYNGIVINLSQPGINALRDLAEALPGTKDDLTTIALNLRKAINQYGTGLGIKHQAYDDIVSDYEQIINGIGDTLESVSKQMNYTADRMQEYVDDHDGGHGPMGPKVKTL